MQVTPTWNKADWFPVTRYDRYAPSVRWARNDAFPLDDMVMKTKEKESPFLFPWLLIMRELMERRRQCTHEPGSAWKSNCFVSAMPSHEAKFSRVKQVYARVFRLCRKISPRSNLDLIHPSACSRSVEKGVMLGWEKPFQGAGIAVPQLADNWWYTHPNGAFVRHAIKRLQGTGRNNKRSIVCDSCAIVQKKVDVGKMRNRRKGERAWMGIRAFYSCRNNK